VRRVRKQLPVPGAVDADNERIWCNWDDCENPSSFLHKVQVCHASGPFRHSDARRCQFCEVKTFCCAQHLDYWQHSHEPGRYGKLSGGLNNVYL
jgi:hypothetical protein